jgi:WD40 repeat protein
VPDDGRTTYDGFISYSHAADGQLAPRLQAGLQRFAKPWWQRRALRIFRDESSLAANPHLWSSITKALDEAGWFVLLLSPDAAESEWVNQEVAYWVEHRDPDRIIPVVTAGEFGWEGDVVGDAVPEALRGVLSEEPRWVDARGLGDPETLDLQNPEFAAVVADLAAPLRGIPKDELASEEVRQHKRTVRTAWAAGVVVLALAVIAGWAGLVASRNADQAQANAAEADRQAAVAEANAEDARANASEAEANAERADAEAEAARAAEALARSRELAASSISVLDQDPELATLLALEAIRSSPTEDLPVELENALWTAGSENRLVDEFTAEAGSHVALSPDGSLLAISERTGVRAVEALSGEPVWEFAEDTIDRYTFAEFGPDGRLAVGVVDESDDVGEGDDLPNRVIILDGASGAELHRIEFPDCDGAEMPTWSPDGVHLVVTSGQDGCERSGVGTEPSKFWFEVFDTQTWETAAFLPLTSGINAGPVARWDETGTLHAMRAYEEVLRFAPGSFEALPSSPATGMGDVSPQGDRYFTFTAEGEVVGGSDFAAYVMDAETGASRHVLFNGDTYVSLPNGLTVTPDGRYVVVGTVTRYTHVYDASSFRELFRLDVGDLYASAFDPEAGRLYTSSSDEGVKVWDLGSNATGVESTLDLGSYLWVNGNAFFPGESIVAMNTINFEIGWAVQAFDPTTGTRVGDTIGNTSKGAFGGLAVHSPLQGDRFLLGHITGPPVLEDGTYGADHLIWDPVIGSTIDLLACDEIALDEFGDAYCDGPGEPKWHWYVAPDDGSELWAFGSLVPFDWEFSGDVVVLDPETGDVLEETTIDEWDGFHPDIDPRAVRFVTDAWTVGNGRDGLVAHDRSTGDVLWQLGGSDKLEVSASRRQVLGQSNGVVHVVETETWSEVAAFEVPGSARGMAFSPDETMVAVGTLDAVYVIDLASGLAVRKVNLTGVSDFVWIDDETVIIGTNDGLFGTLSLSTDDFLHATRANLRRSFTDDECQRYGIDPCPTLEELRGES